MHFKYIKYIRRIMCERFRQHNQNIVIVCIREPWNCSTVAIIQWPYHLTPSEARVMVDFQLFVILFRAHYTSLQKAMSKVQFRLVYSMFKNQLMT